MEATSTTYSEEQLLRYYDEQHFKLVRVSRATKKPLDPDWPNRKISPDAAVAWVNRGGNIGIQAGEVSSWICAADMDCPEAVQLAPGYLPETLKIHKGNQAPSVYVYRSPGLGFQKYKGLDGSTLIDLKASNNGAGHMFVVAPSIHPDKGRYEWAGGFNPATIAEAPETELRAAVDKLAVAVLVAQHLPDTGRHDLALALAGYLLRNGVAVEDVQKILLSAWQVRGAPREAFRDIEGIVRDTKARLDHNEPATGGRTLEETIPGLPSRIAKFLGWDHTNNQEHRRNYTHSDLGNAERFVDVFGDQVRWCPARKLWMFYDGTRWRWDDCGYVVKLAHKSARAIHTEAAAEPDPAKQRVISKFAVSSQNEGRINGMLSQTKPYLAVRMDDLDTDPWLINCQNGTLDLRTGQLRNHSPADLITKIVPVDYDPGADCPQFKSFLKEVLVDPAVIAFIKRFSGYTLTGITRERAFTILYGFGKNGKSTLIELLQDALGDYSTNTDTETILTKKYQGVGNDVAALRGARFVSAAEVEKGRRLAESKVKQLTGSDTVTARYLFGEPFDFRPEFKLWLSTNNKPVIQGTEDAIWDRIRLVPFTQRFEGDQADPKLPEKLREELPGVFAWMVEGCLEWQEHGLGEPESVKAATDEYRQEMDTLTAFLEERCVVHVDAVAPATPLYEAYRSWCEDAGERAEKQKMFGMRLRERGFTNSTLTSGPHKARKGWFGVGLRVDHPDPEDPQDPNPSHKGNAETGGNGQPGRPLGRDGQPNENGGFASKTPAVPVGVDHSRPKNQNLPLKKLREERVLEKRSTSSTPTTPEEKTDAESDRLLAAGWHQKERGENALWINPRNGFAYAKEPALAELDREMDGEYY